MPLRPHLPPARIREISWWVRDNGGWKRCSCAAYYYLHTRMMREPQRLPNISIAFYRLIKPETPQ